MNKNTDVQDKLKILNEAQAEPLDQKIARATALIKEALAIGPASVAWSGGKDSTVLIDLLRQLAPDIPVVWNNSGVEFPETWPFIKRMAAEWHLNLHIAKHEPGKDVWPKLLMMILILCLLIVPVLFAAPAPAVAAVPTPEVVLMEYEQAPALTPGAVALSSGVFSTLGGNLLLIDNANAAAASPALRLDLNIEVTKTKGGRLLNSVNANPAYSLGGSFWSGTGKFIY